MKKIEDENVEEELEEDAEEEEEELEIEDESEDESEDEDKSEGNKAVDEWFRNYLETIGKYGNLTIEEEIELGKAKDAGDEEAREKLINHNLRLVVNVAKRYVKYGMSIEDLVAFGNIGLVEAVDKFDPCKGYKLNTYAIAWIRMEIANGIYSHKERIVKPKYIKKTIYDIKKIEESLEKIMGRTPAREEISQITNGYFSPQQVNDIQAVIRQDNVYISLDEAISSGDDSPNKKTHLIDTVVDKWTPQPDEVANEVLKGEAILRAVGKLKPQYQTIIKMKYGIGNDYDNTKRYTFDDIAKQLKEEGYTNRKGNQVTRQCVEQMENEALKILGENEELKLIREEMAW